MRKRSPKTWAFVVVVVIMAAVFVRLGFWQLGRLAERRASADEATSRLALDLLNLNSWLAERGAPSVDDRLGEELTWRRVTVSGIPDYENEIVLRGRSRDGVPGVHVVTPLLTPVSEGDPPPAILVVRGWLPAPDAMRANLQAARPEASRRAHQMVVVSGFVRPPEVRHAVAPMRIDFEGESHPVMAVLDLTDAAEVLPYPVAPVAVQRVEEAGVPGTAWNAPRPPLLPAFDGGPHLMYAVQWFAFAVIVGVGGVAFARRA